MSVYVCAYVSEAGASASFSPSYYRMAVFTLPPALWNPVFYHFGSLTDGKEPLLALSSLSLTGNRAGHLNRLLGHLVLCLCQVLMFTVFLVSFWPEAKNLLRGLLINSFIYLFIYYLQLTL